MNEKPNEREDGLVEIKQTYTAVLQGRVVVHDVPMLQDPDSQETLLTPETAEKLYNLLSRPEQKTGVTTADIYAWDAPTQAA